MLHVSQPTWKHRQLKLLEQVRHAIRVRHYSLRTEETYVQWIRRFILFHNKRHPRDMGAEEIQQFLTDLAVTHRVAASTQNQALSALLFLYKVILDQDPGWIEGIVRAKKPKRLPVVLTRDEVKAVLGCLSGRPWLMVSLLYGSGLRLMECVRLRVKDVDFPYHQITVRDGKGGRDRVTMLSRNLQEPLQRHLHTVKRLHERDVEEGFGSVYLPYALAKKYPSASRDWGWQYVFPADRHSHDPRTGIKRRHHVAPLVLQRAVKAALRQAGISKCLKVFVFDLYVGEKRRTVCCPERRDGADGRWTTGADCTLEPVAEGACGYLSCDRQGVSAASFFMAGHGVAVFSKVEVSSCCFARV